MKARRTLLAIGVLAAAWSLGGCLIRHGDFTVLSSKMIRTSEFELSKADRARGIKGTDIAHIILFIPTGTPTLEDAINDALDQGGGDVMTDAVVHSWSWWALLYGQSGWTVEGDVVRTRKN
jgi:hypothetical protein